MEPRFAAGVACQSPSNNRAAPIKVRTLRNTVAGPLQSRKGDVIDVLVDGTAADGDAGGATRLPTH